MWEMCKKLKMEKWALWGSTFQRCLLKKELSEYD